MLSAYFFNDGEILVPSDVRKNGAEGTGRAPTIKRDKTVRATSKYVIPSGTKCSRVYLRGSVLVKWAPKCWDCVRGPAEELPIWERLMPRAASPIKARW